MQKIKQPKIGKFSVLKQKKIILFRMIFLGWLMGFEPTTLGTTIRCSNRLNYSHRFSGCKITTFFQFCNAFSTEELKKNIQQIGHRATQASGFNAAIQKT